MCNNLSRQQLCSISVSNRLQQRQCLTTLQTTAATTHTGFEGVSIKDENRLVLGRFHHQMHHRYFECNYGSLEIPWDKFFGSFHDGTNEADKRMKERRKRMMGA